MDKIKKYIRPVLKCTIFVVTYLLLISILSYTGIIKLGTVVTINFVFVAIMSLLFGISKGKKTSKRGYLEGLKYSSIIVLVMFIMNLIFYREFNLYIFLFYLLIIASTTIGSMIGINLKR